MEKYGESRRSKENPRLDIQTREFAENVFLEHFLGAAARRSASQPLENCLRAVRHGPHFVLKHETTIF